MPVKTPTVLQMESVECGAAALGIILSYYGRIVPLAELRVECGVSRDGSKASKILQAARHYGMEADGYKVELDAVRQQVPPFIVFWQFNHFLVIEGFRRNRVFINDPAIGRYTITWQEFDQSFTGVVLLMEPGESFEVMGRKPHVLFSLFNRLRSSINVVLFCIIAGFLLVVPGLVIPVFSQVFVDHLLVENRTEWLRPLVLGMIVTTFVQGCLTVLQLRYLRKLKIKLAVGMSSHFLWHILRLPVGFYAQRFSGEICNRLGINNAVADVLSGQLATTAINAIMICFYAGLMYIYDPVLTGIGVSFSSISVLILRWMARRRIDANLRLVQDRGKLTGISISALQGIEMLKSSALESDFFARWSGNYTKVINIQQELEITNQILATLPTLLTTLTSTLILTVGGIRVIQGELTIGMLVAFQALMVTFQSPVNALVGFGSLLQDLEGYINRLDDALNNPVDVELEANHLDETPTLEEFKPQLRGQVELRHLTFGYSPVDPPLIVDLSLSLQPGQRVALVGQSGSGKSTITKLICGLYQPWEGEILLDGKPRSAINRDVLAHSLAIVEQEIFLFEGTVRDNLTLWERTIPEEQLVKACQDALIHDFIMTVLGGYDGKLLEGGVNLSGGQRQRLEIARALVRNPTILVLDEATSALDVETEKQLVQNLKYRGCTCIIAAHRLSTVRDCDEIIVLEQGRIVERGTHEQLWGIGGIYYELVQAEVQQEENSTWTF